MTGAALLLDPLLQGELDGDRGQRLGGVVGGAGLPVPAGEAVDERAGPVPHALPGLEAVLVLDLDEHVVGVVGDLGGGDHPRPAGRVAVLRDLVQLLVGDEAGVGHQALVDRAELADAELGVGDEPAALGPAPAPAPAGAAALGEHEAAEHPVERAVAEPGVVARRVRVVLVVAGADDRADQPGPGRVEQVGLQRLEPEPLPLGQPVGRGAAPGTVAVVHHAEQHGEGLVQVEALARLLAAEAAGDEVAEAGHASTRRCSPRRRPGGCRVPGRASA